MRRRSSLLALCFSLLNVVALRATVDFDGDGVSDIWRETYPAAGVPAADPDGDGADNLAESLAGTNPLDRTSRLAAFAPETDPSGNTLLRWSGVDGKRYRIDSSTDLTTWTLGTELLTAAQSPRLVRTAGAATRSRQFWRVTALDTDTDSDGINDWEEAQLGSDPAVPAIQLQSHFVPFGMCFGDLNAAEQIARCQSRGFTGLGIQNFDVATLKDFAANAEVTSGRFKIYSALWWVNTDTVFAASVLTDLKLKLAELKKLNAYLWIVCDTNGAANRIANAVTNIQKAADACALYGVTLVIYPHGGAAIDRAEQAKALLPQINRANVKISLHLCHEVMAGNGARIAEVVAAVKNDIVLASISGSSVAVYPDDNWAHQIQPLDRGDYDIRPFLHALATAGYSGPLELHTYNLGDPGATPTATDHLSLSLKKWRTLVAPTAHCP
jgi:sugar phosphate isomerase/epimerase